MWFFLLVALAFFKGVSCKSRACENMAEMECIEKHLPRSSSLPDTKDEIRNACSNFDEITFCKDEFVRNCTEESVGMYERDPSYYETMEVRRRWQLFDDLKPICKRHAYINSAEFKGSVCEARANRNCRVHTVMPEELPASEKELEKACQNLYRVKQCLLDSKEECLRNTESFDEDDVKFLGYMEFDERLIGVFTDICQKDSDLHKEFVPKLACYNWLMELEEEDTENRCENYVSNAFGYLEVLMERKATSAGRPPLYAEYRGCLRQIFTFNCFAFKSDKMCGPRARDVLVGLFQRTADLKDVCPRHIIFDVWELMGDFEAMTKSKIQTKSLLPKVILL